MATLLEVTNNVGLTEYYGMEKELKGEFAKHTNNVGHVNTAAYSPTLQASHYHHSNSTYHGII